MSISQFLQEATIWLAWAGIGLGICTLLAFLLRWGIRFRLVGASIFTLLLSGSCFAFQTSYSPPVNIEGALYVPVVYDNGADLVVAQAPEGFPDESIQPSLEQIAGNLKGSGRNGAKVNIRIRKIESAGDGISRPIILGEVISDPTQKTTIPIETNNFYSVKKVDAEEISEPALDEENSTNKISGSSQQGLNDNEEFL
ncbi:MULTISPECIES: Ycf51 family protein [Prochlorococcus]|uniref:Uncharacterized membrane protein n=1 Tax=Prochlorococcus marinus (strain SARG / CCMP1375 / SS120) TaxID=167539 RepID=Q7VBL8_PROMA|nr:MULTISPECIES: Ycf51 family protein [Prochlorococcus]AAQ00119.1 Uncharacterized membrane protein [Prochlorococcus marinus subsp. marinus str. CCMP1375]KGG13915.1 hypothetical protein EV04_0400 [Prochlorococcus marinus str. LG]KGG19048.1 hypothetical protein EV08_1535 [Prochlorococcus marinus str. SS2]KGG23412.1 hypothetical protein EV09_1036 [Prochlorococcus marinus str. SS35]KGG32352.1 hypothetical protein EV10_1467 [Prochlorococcus marinus str. SS51]